MSLNNFKYFIPLFFLLVFLSFNKHSKDKEKSYHGVIWADAAGYYVYNPYWFAYSEERSIPDTICNNVGDGFYKDSLSGKIITKYYCGTALLQTPFFIVSHALSSSLGFQPTGFSKIYSYGLYVAGVFYTLFGLIILFFFLKRHFSTLVSIVSVASFFICTNLYYYTIDAPGMSHVYSFFVFSCIVGISPLLLNKGKWIHFFTFFICIYLSLLIRPTNIFAGFFPLFYGIFSSKDLWDRMIYFFSKRYQIIISSILALVVFIPQLLYWKDVTGNYFTYPYKGEGFDNLFSPYLLEVWFSTNNGLFIYTPLMLVSLIGCWLMVKDKNKMGHCLLFLFFIISYLFASWWNWWFGCSFGARSFVEYYALFIFSFAFLLNRTINSKSKIGLSVLVLFIILCGVLNMNIEYYYDGCFYGGTWDWATFLKLI